MLTTPVRLLLSRRKGFDLQAHSRAANGLDAVRVARPGNWGNPYPVVKLRRAHRQAMDWSGRCTSLLWASWADSYFEAGRGRDPELDAELDGIAQTAAVALFAAEARQFERSDPPGFRAWLAPLRGKNLACFCRLDQPCHADVLLELANRAHCDDPAGEAVPSINGAEHE